MVVESLDEMEATGTEDKSPRADASAHQVTQVREVATADDPSLSDASRTTTPRTDHLATGNRPSSGDRHSRDRSREPDVSPKHRRSSRHHHHPDADASDEMAGASLPKVHRKPPPPSFSDPTASPGQRTLSKTRLAAAVNLEKSPHRKRSKSESRRRRDRKMIAAGELEVRQANETLMRYLRQCTEINDASLSGELEIDKSYDDRKVHRKTKSQRERRGLMHGVSGASAAGAGQQGQHGVGSGARARMQLHSGLTNILNTLVDDITPSNGEIYNPFTPVISPTEGGLQHLSSSKLFVQPASSYREVDDGFHADVERDDGQRDE